MNLNMLKSWRAVIFGAALTLVAQASYAQTSLTEALLAQRLQALEERLTLDARQSVAVAEIQEASFYELALAIEELKVAEGRLEKLRLARDIGAIRKTTRDQMAVVLTPAQLALLDAFMAEQEQAFRRQTANQ